LIGFLECSLVEATLVVCHCHSSTLLSLSLSLIPGGHTLFLLQTEAEKIFVSYYYIAFKKSEKGRVCERDCFIFNPFSFGDHGTG